MGTTDMTTVTTAAPAKPAREFDATIEAMCAETWWDLGKLLAHLDDDTETQKRVEAIREDLHPDLKPYVTIDTVREFARTVYDVLCRFYDGADVKADIERLMETESHTVQEANGFIEVDESFEAFWGFEYGAVFTSLGKPYRPEDDPSGWRNAVHRCSECGTFFVKQRRDQMFDKTLCRTRATNRDAYATMRRTRRRVARR
jgi:hypothetical protein